MGKAHAWWVMPCDVYGRREWAKPKHTTEDSPRPVYRAEEVFPAKREDVEALVRDAHAVENMARHHLTWHLIPKGLRESLEDLEVSLARIQESAEPSGDGGGA